MTSNLSSSMQTSRDHPSIRGTTAIELSDLAFAYPGGSPVLEHLDLAIETGSILGIVGPSGGGKSTLLSLAAGLIEPTAGSVSRRDDGSGRHPMSMMFQRETLLPWLTVEENARSFERYKSQRRKSNQSEQVTLDERVTSLLELAHLEDSREKYPYQLSGGMRRRLAFVAAVCVNPQVLLLDEPFSSVDEPTRVGIHQDVFDIARLLGMTMVLVTHDLAEAITLCDRVVILSARPARVAHVHTVNFGPERNMLDLRNSPEYASLYAALWSDLGAEIVRGRGGSAS